MEIAAVSAPDYFDVEENFPEDKFEDSSKHGKYTERQINKIFKGTIVCANNQDKGTHRLSGAIETERKTNEQHGKTEYKGKASFKYEYNSKNRLTKFKTEAAVDSKGDFEGRAELSREW